MILLARTLHRARSGGGIRGKGRHAHSWLLASISVLAAPFVLLWAPAEAGCPQSAETLSQVTRVYVGSLGDKQGAADIRDKLRQRLRKSRDIEVVGSPSEADAIVTGTGEIWVKGYISANPKRSSYSHEPVYDGYLSVDLQGKGDKTLWSYRATPGKFLWHGVTQDLVSRVAKQLLADLKQNAGIRR